MIPLIIAGTKKTIRINKPVLVTLHGQSNMIGNATNWNDITDESLIGLQTGCYVYNLAGDEFQQMNVGVNHNVDGGGTLNFGPEVYLMTALQKIFNQNVHYVKYAVGGTYLVPSPSNPDLDVWSVLRTGEYWDNYTHRIDSAIALMDSTYGSGNWIHFGNLWHQGESDRSDVYGEYESEEINMINEYRSLYGSDVIWISGGIKNNVTGVDDPVNVAKKANASKSNINYFFSTDDFVLADTVHYNSDSQLLHGERYYNILK